MNRQIRRCLPLLRLPALALLMLAVLVVPVFAALGDLHEAQQGSAAHLHATGEHGYGPAEEDLDGDSDLLHALMHASHCCGHPTIIVASMQTPGPVMAVMAAPVEVFSSSRLEVPDDLFRPPITA